MRLSLSFTTALLFLLLAQARAESTGTLAHEKPNAVTTDDDDDGGVTSSSSPGTIEQSNSKDVAEDAFDEYEDEDDTEWDREATRATNHGAAGPSHQTNQSAPAAADDPSVDLEEEEADPERNAGDATRTTHGATRSSASEKMDESATVQQHENHHHHHHPPVMENPAGASSNNNNNHNNGKQARLWGAPAPHDEEHHNNNSPPPKEELKLKEDHQHQQQQHQQLHDSPSHNLHIPFVPKTTQHPPPDGYHISARVYIDPTDKLGHIDADPLSLPYWDCGAVGSTTSPLAVKEVTFRHSLSPCKAWSGTDGKHPILAVALSPFILEVSSGATQTIQPGQAILLEDVLVPGHKFRPLAHNEIRVMLLTLPKTYYSTGRDKISIATNFKQDPCPIPEQGTAPHAQEHQSASRTVQRAQRETLARKIALGVVGLSLSTLAADFLGKTAPLWLAVGVGGAFFVVAGTVGTIALGEAAASNFEAWMQQRRLNIDRPRIPLEKMAL